MTRAEITHMWSRLCGLVKFVFQLSHMMGSHVPDSSGVIQRGYFLCGHMRIHSLYCGCMCPTWRDINHGNTLIGVNL